jgi:Endoribonuclease L-PSP
MAEIGNPPAIHHVDAPGYPAAHSPYAHAVVANGFVFVSGQIPVRPGGAPTEIAGDTMQEQTRQALLRKATGRSHTHLPTKPRERVETRTIRLDSLGRPADCRFP